MLDLHIHGPVCITVIFICEYFTFEKQIEKLNSLCDHPAVILFVQMVVDFAFMPPFQIAKGNIFC